MDRPLVGALLAELGEHRPYGFGIWPRSKDTLLCAAHPGGSHHLHSARDLGDVAHATNAPAGIS
jgi:hypothetical protein